MDETDDVVLVTGGTGFIGTWVVRGLLDRGLRVVAFDRQFSQERWQRILGDRGERLSGKTESQLILVTGSLQDRELLDEIVQEHRATLIIHLAALLTPDCQRDPYLGCEVNVLGSVAVFELARKWAPQIRGISYASSYAVYGPEADDAPSAESTAQFDRSPTFYGAFKRAVDSFAEQYWLHFGIPSMGIRPHVVYGPERSVGLTAGPSLACRAAARGEPYAINYTGQVGYDYVEDVARAFIDSALATPAGATTVDLESQLATTEEFVQIIDRIVPGSITRIRVGGGPIPENVSPRPHRITEVFPTWRTTTLEEGVRSTINFYRKSS